MRLYFLAVLTMVLSGCVSPEQMRQERLVGTQNGENIYRFWMYKDYQLKGWGDTLCPKGGWREISRDLGQRDYYSTGTVGYTRQRIYVTIACPA